MYSYYANNPIIKTLTDEQLEAAYRVRQMQYRIEDIKAHAEDMFDRGDLTAAEYAYVCDSAQELAERYIYKFQDCNLAENDVMVNMIGYFCEDHAQEINEDSLSREKASLNAQINSAEKRSIDGTTQTSPSKETER